MKILVLGGSGFLGKKLIDNLSQQPIELFAAVRNIPAISNQNCTYVLVGDLIKDSSLGPLVFDVIINVAMKRSSRHLPVSDEVIRELNYEIPLSVIRRYSNQSTLVINTSTYIQNYKGVKGQTVETYGATKELLSTALKSDAGTGLYTVLDLYLFTLYGPGDRGTHLVPLLLSAIRNRTVVSLSEGNQLMNLLYAQEAVDSIVGEITTNTQQVPGSLQSSAFSLTGPNFATKEKPRNFVSYVHKSLEGKKYKHFGTRVRIVGKIESNEDRGQTSNGSSTYYVVNGSTPDKNINVAGGSAGIAVILNPKTNVGYYFEIAALGLCNLSETDRQSVSNVFFYKVKSDSGKAIPIGLWDGLATITVDDGRFTGQSRVFAEENPTVYDLAVEYEDIGKTRRFYLYINGRLIKTVDDNDPLPIYSSIALFARGSSRAMFENVYALCNNYSQNTSFSLGAPVNSVFGDSEIDANESFRKYAISGLIQNTYLSGIGSSGTCVL